MHSFSAQLLTVPATALGTRSSIRVWGQVGDKALYLGKPQTAVWTQSTWPQQSSHWITSSSSQAPGWSEMGTICSLSEDDKVEFKFVPWPALHFPLGNRKRGIKLPHLQCASLLHTYTLFNTDMSPQATRAFISLMKKLTLRDAKRVVPGHISDKDNCVKVYSPVNHNGVMFTACFAKNFYTHTSDCASTPMSSVQVDC